MIIRQKLPVDTAFCIDTDVEPWILWGEVPADWVIKIMELSQPVGFIVYRFVTNLVVIEKLCIRDDLQRTGLGTETLNWLCDRARKRGYRTVAVFLTEEQVLGPYGPTPIVSLLRSVGFEGKITNDGKYTFTRSCK